MAGAGVQWCGVVSAVAICEQRWRSVVLCEEYCATLVGDCSVGRIASSGGCMVGSAGHNVSSVDLGQAVAAEAREGHEIHVLNVGAHLQCHRTVSG